MFWPGSKLRPAYAWVGFSLAAILLFAVGAMLQTSLSGWHGLSYPLHSFMETIGAVSAVTTAMLMFQMQCFDRLPRYFIWIVIALTMKGILDGAHAAVLPGDAFIWLHSLSMLLGGLLFGAVWLPTGFLDQKIRRVLLAIATTVVLLIGLGSLMYPESVPVMSEAHSFTLAADLMNIVGGLGFFVGMIFFILAHSRNESDQYGENYPNRHLVFAILSLLFGFAGIMFEHSRIWGATWWWWHFLSLAAYLLVLGYFMLLFRQQQEVLQNNQVSLTNNNLELERKVAARTRDLQKANEAKSGFLAHMSHELRTPLNAMMGFTQLLELDEDQFSPSQREAVKEILLAGNHLLLLVNEILDLAKIEAGKTDIRMDQVQLSEVLKESITLTRPAAQLRHIEVIDNVSMFDYVVFADPLRLKQVLVNLISNAIKYNRLYGAVSLDAKVTGSGRIVIRVSDTGEGITADEIRRLFVPFERLNASEAIEGSGIGLVITRHLVELMAGDIGVESARGRGSTFWIELNLLQA
ncbi:MAG: ATP-binding protein [Gammaproteobacteria bacterium]|nr:ATP-binding protein [Gammaproteobacteria bacterium]